MAYAGFYDKKWVMIIDKEESRAYDDIGDSYFSPDSKRIAYSSQIGSKWLVVVDGVEFIFMDRL